jgi:transaldolase
MPESSLDKLKKLYQLGQSPWYDNIDRRLIENGELKSLFDRGIVGVTSNPTIFEKAINSPSVYDEKIKRLKKEGKDLFAIYDELTADDVRDTADMLKGVYEKTAGVDGYVSIEVLPTYAYDPLKTLEYGRFIYKKVGRKNIMIKVPGTKESPAAITALIREGINVNVTLLFSLSQYEAIARAYWEGLLSRARDGYPIRDVASVASIFVSRIDTKTDQLLDIFVNRVDELEKKRKISSLKGKIAIANAKMLYQKFKDIFSEARFGELKFRGASVQRLLWASTGTKNPQYSDVLYVDNLIGPLTVNTMPHQTVLAFQDHGQLRLTLESDLEGARASLAQLEELGISLEKLCQEAQKEGVAAFNRSFEALTDSLKSKLA